MNFIKTPTPDYRQNGYGSKPRPTGFLGWLASLLQTPTPAYKPAPELNKQGETHDD